MDHTSTNNMSMLAKPHEGLNNNNTKFEKWNNNNNKNETTFPYQINIISKNDNEDHHGPPSYMAAAVAVAVEAVGKVSPPPPSGGERVKKYWGELSARRVFIPERWNQEEFLMDWIDYSSFDSLLAPKGIDSARKALIAQAQRPHQQEKGF